MATRTQGQRLTKAQKAELGPQAVAMNARGVYYSDIAEELDVNWKTVGKLIDDELAERAEHRANSRERHISVYDRVQREAWELYDNCPDDRAQNKASALNAVLSAENSKVKLTGAETPKKNELTGPDGGPIEHSHQAEERDERFERLYAELNSFGTSEDESDSEGGRGVKVVE